MSAEDVVDELICSLHILPLDWKNPVQDTISNSLQYFAFLFEKCFCSTPVKASRTQFIWFYQYYPFLLTPKVQIIINKLLAFMNDNSMLVSFLFKTMNYLILLTHDVQLF